MNSKLLIFLALIAFTFGFATYEAMKMDKKLGSSVGEILIKEMPTDLTLKGFDNQQLDLRAGGEVFTVVHFWATWCAPCEIEFPELVNFINSMKNRKDMRFVLVAVNDDDTKVKKFLSKFNIENENVVLVKDSDNNYQKFGSYKLPETFLFDKKFQTLRKFEGQQAWSQNTILDYFNSL